MSRIAIVCALSACSLVCRCSLIGDLCLHTVAQLSCFLVGFSSAHAQVGILILVVPHGYVQDTNTMKNAQMLTIKIESLDRERGICASRQKFAARLANVGYLRVAATLHQNVCRVS